MQSPHHNRGESPPAEIKREREDSRSPTADANRRHADAEEASPRHKSKPKRSTNPEDRNSHGRRNDSTDNESGRRQQRSRIRENRERRDRRDNDHGYRSSQHASSRRKRSDSPRHREYRDEPVRYNRRDRSRNRTDISNERPRWDQIWTLVKRLPAFRNGQGHSNFNTFLTQYERINDEFKENVRPVNAGNEVWKDWLRWLAERDLCNEHLSDMGAFPYPFPRHPNTLPNAYTSTTQASEHNAASGTRTNRWAGTRSQYPQHNFGSADARLSQSAAATLGSSPRAPRETGQYPQSFNNRRPENMDTPAASQTRGVTNSVAQQHSAYGRAHSDIDNEQMPRSPLRRRTGPKDSEPADNQIYLNQRHQNQNRNQNRNRNRNQNRGSRGRGRGRGRGGGRP